MLINRISPFASELAATPFRQFCVKVDKTIITIGVAYAQLIEDVRALVRHELNNRTPTPSNNGTDVGLGEKLLTVREAAVELNVTVQTVHEWKRRGLLKYHKLGSRSYLKRSDVLAALQGHQRSMKTGKGSNRG